MKYKEIYYIFVPDKNNNPRIIDAETSPRGFKSKLIMNTNLNEKVEKVTLVDDVVLTSKALLRLKAMQEHDNEMLKLMRNNIADAVCTLSWQMDNLDQDKIMEIKDTLTGLAFVRDELKDLAKP